MTALEFYNSRVHGTQIKHLLAAVNAIGTANEARQFYFGYIEHQKLTHGPERAVEIARTNLAWAIKQVVPTSQYGI